MRARRASGAGVDAAEGAEGGASPAALRAATPRYLGQDEIGAQKSDS